MATQNILTMDVRTVPLAEVTPYPGNARLGNLSTIAASLRTNGQYRPLVVQKSTGHVLCGNNTLAAAQQLGWDTIAVQYVDVDDTQAKKILLVDNKANDEADYDDSALLKLLEDLSDLDDLTGTGFADQALTELRQTSGVFAEQASSFLNAFNPLPPSRHNTSGPEPFTPTPTPTQGPADAPTPAPTPGETPTAPPPAPTQAPAPVQPGVNYVSVTYTLTEEERTELRTAIHHAREKWNTETSSDAFAKIVSFYIQEHGL